MKHNRILFLFTFLCCLSVSAGNVISVTDFGLKPNSRVNATPYVQKAID